MLDAQFFSPSEKTEDSKTCARKLAQLPGEVGVLDIALVNNMPEAAIEATERQFSRMLQAAAGPFEVRLHRFMLPERHGGDPWRASNAGRYASVERIEDFRIDALIVTGSEPLRTRLPEESYWPSLTKLIDWAQSNTISALWSCLAAHAAVLRLDGVERRPVSHKRSGVFACEIVSEHPIVRGCNLPVFVPHSRLNEVREQDLRACGYEILTVSPEAGVDAFVRPGASLFLFLQGHPEYEPRSLLLEYRRDLGRYLRGERPRPPVVPHNYFDTKTRARLESLTIDAQETRRRNTLKTMLRAPLTLEFPEWDSWSATLMRNWLLFIAHEKARRDKDIVLA